MATRFLSRPRIDENTIPDFMSPFVQKIPTKYDIKQLFC